MNFVQLWKRPLVVALVVVILSASSGTVRADLIHVGDTYFADDLEDDTIGSNPNNTAGFVSLASFGTGSRTLVRTDPAGGTNQVLLSDTTGAAHGSAPITGTTGKRYIFSGAMVAEQPDVGNLSYRVYLDQVDTGAASFAPTSLLDVIKVNNGSTSTNNQAFSLKANANLNKFQFVSSGSTSSVTDLVLDEWVDVSIDYDLTSIVDNLTLTLSSPTIGSNVSTYSQDLTAQIASPIPTIWTFNRAGSGGTGDLTQHDIYAIDDISWTASAVPEPSSLVFCSIGFLLSLCTRRRKN